MVRCLIAGLAMKFIVIFGLREVHALVKQWYMCWQPFALRFRITPPSSLR